MARSGSGESVLERVVRILEAFTPRTPVLTVGEVARRADLPVATASRLIAELVEHGLLSRDDDRRVRVGTRLWELGSRASPTLSLRELAMPVLEELLRVVGHHAQLGVLDGEEVLFVERLSAEHAVINYTRIAARLPLHASSSGLVLLAHAPHELRERILAEPLAGLAPETVTDAAAVRRILGQIRSKGFVIAPGYIEAVSTGVAVPLRDGSGDIIAALSVVLPRETPTDVALSELLGAARGIRTALRQ